ncbi:MULTISPECIES: hypothetical protein [unclassified Streptomyces]|uniref:hypothetical protein n=1 Tax=unclassified Streptomyces TaxID=2593676 RepID=UPI0011B0DB5C|nr:MULTISPECIES: hypothetical protein [unclassified Streptomyces]
MTLPLVPLGAQAPCPTHQVAIDPRTFTYDAERQLNVTRTGRLWAHEPIAASSTATNNDTTPGNPPDEGADPYTVPEVAPGVAPVGNRLGRPSDRTLAAFTTVAAA